MNFLVRKFFCSFLALVLFFSCAPAGLAAQEYSVFSSPRLEKLQSAFYYNLGMDNTLYKRAYPLYYKGERRSLFVTEPPFSLKYVIPAFNRYTRDGGDLLRGGLGLFPARAAVGAESLAQTIRQMASLAPTQITVNMLLRVLQSPYVHESVFIEANFALAQIILKNTAIEDAAELKKYLIDEFNFMKNFDGFELVYGSGKDYDAKLRAQMAEMIVSLGGQPKESWINPAAMAQINSKVNNVLYKANILGYAVMIASLGRVRLPSAGAPVAPRPVPAASRPVMRLGSRPSVAGASGMRVSSGPNMSITTASAPSAGAFEGSAALKMAPQTLVRPLAKTIPLSSPAAVPSVAPAYVPQQTPMVFGAAQSRPASRPFGEPEREPTKKEKQEAEAAALRILLSNDNLITLPNQADINKLSVSALRKAWLKSRLAQVKQKAQSRETRFQVRPEDEEALSAVHFIKQYSPYKPVWELFLPDFKTSYYLKYGYPSEPDFLFNLQKADIPSYFANIDIYIPRLVCTGIDRLPPKIRVQILEDLPFVAQVAYLPQDRSSVAFVMTKIPYTGGLMLSEAREFPNALHTHFADKPIEAEEWESFKEAMRMLQAAGVPVWDLDNNVFISRDKKDMRLKVSVLDFERRAYGAGYSNVEEYLKSFEKELLRYELLDRP